MKIEIVSILTRDRYENYILFHLQAIVGFFYRALSSKRCSEVESATESAAFVFNQSIN